MQQSEVIHRQTLRRLYKMSITGLYDELLDEVVSHMVWILSRMKSTVGSSDLLKMLTTAKTDGEKMIAIDTVIHKTHTSGFYAQHIIQGTDKVDIMNFLSELAGISNNDEYEKLMVQLQASNISTVLGHALYSTIDLTGFEELNKTAIRNTRARFEAMGIKEYSFTEKTLLDIGCNVGHMLFEATTCGFPISYGLEQAPHIVAAGNAIADYLKISDRIIIKQADADSLTKDVLKKLTGKEKFDIVFCFAVDGYVGKYVKNPVGKYVKNPEVFYRLLKDITKEILYFEPNNHKINWDVDTVLKLGFKSVEKVIVPYDKNTGSTRECFICHK